MSKAVLITGTSTGIGRTTALKLAQDGYIVFAGVRRQTDADGLLAEAGNGRLTPILLDVTQPESIEAAFQTVKAKVGSQGLWALVSNAGVVVPGPIEHLTSDDWQRQFEVNFFGPIQLVRTMLPLLRQGVSTYGRDVPRILLVSSIGARVAQPILSPYTSSKAATSSFGESLRIELYRQGIGVTVAEPGAIATAIWTKGEDSTREFVPNHPARILYGREIDGVSKMAMQTAAGAISSEHAADALVKALVARKPPIKLLIGRDAVIAATFKKWLPATWFEAVLRRQFGVKLDTWVKPGAAPTQ
jgi:NAD(P)-dependent dehydrogenase (short-subunit alcohol dehydrogenase family)